ncbi:MAG TPA: FixH family protein [Gammaproteobacteria bacterium]|nr:FixH family protein [Gammaproteobacteria bacterium]
MNESGHRPQPWHREPLVWLVIAFPLAAVIGGIATLLLAIHSWDGLVVDDYYKKGLEINKVIARDDAAIAAGFEAKVLLDPDRVTIVLASTHGAALPAGLKVSFIHATRAGLDRSLDLPRDGDGHYSAPMSALPPGHWHVHIETPEWRIIEQIRR